MVVLVLMVVGIAIVSMSLALVITTSQSMGGAMESGRIRAVVESGVENAILKLLRNPSYAGESMVVDEVTVVVTVTQGAQTTIIATATSGEYRQRYQVLLERISGVLTVVSWQQID